MNEAFHGCPLQLFSHEDRSPTSQVWCGQREKTDVQTLLADSATQERRGIQGGRGKRLDREKSQCLPRSFLPRRLWRMQWARRAPCVCRKPEKEMSRNKELPTPKEASEHPSKIGEGVSRAWMKEQKKECRGCSPRTEFSILPLVRPLPAHAC